LCALRPEHYEGEKFPINQSEIKLLPNKFRRRAVGIATNERPRTIINSPQLGSRDVFTHTWPRPRNQNGDESWCRSNYVWKTEGGTLNYDTHGDGPGGKEISYAKGRAVDTDQGSITAAFDGNHGWF